MSLAVQLGVLGAYLLVALAVGVVAYRRTDRRAEDYYLAGRTLGTVVLLFTTFATLLSAFTFFGGPNVAFWAGPEWILVMGLMDGVLFALLWYVVGYKQWLVGKEHGYVTLGEMLGDRFGSTRLRGVVAGVSILWLFPYVMLQQMGAGTAVVGLTDGAVPYWAGAALITVFMVGYVALSGLRGVAWTDTLQGVFMLGVLWLAVGWIATSAGGIGALTAGMAEANPEFAALGGGLYSVQYVVGTAVVIAFGVAAFPQVNQRFFMADRVETLKRSFALWPVLVLLLFVPAFLLGSWAVGLGITVPENSNVLPVLLNEYTPAWFAAAVVAGALAAMMSSSDSMLLSGSSYLTRDLYRPFVAPDAGDERESWVARVGVAAFAVGTFVASLFAQGGGLDAIITVGDTAFGGYAQVTLPLLCALYWSGTTRTGMLTGVVASQALYLAHVFVPSVTVMGTTLLGDTYLTWDFALWCMLASLLVTVGVSALTTNAPEENAAKFGVRAD
ncbi:sodium:solute symporter family protein [Halosegnis marinus]|uniref:Sodium:solute symporter n=1 Tax=Halosegnis marinus TaxID=3034023 RepID=A0ABD5ZLC6_9EURY|nr:sodium:solute symporter family protein [Halosegnis sp. DT85]